MSAAALRRAGRGAVALRAAVAANADRHGRDPVLVADIRERPAGDHGGVNDRGMTRRGGRWRVSTVRRLLDRLGFRAAACASPG
jgi:hypothetical protein